jgi:hypothetical protein
MPLRVKLPISRHNFYFYDWAEDMVGVSVTGICRVESRDATNCPTIDRVAP